MAEVFKVSGECTSRAIQGNPSGYPNLTIPLDERMNLEASVVGTYVLTSNTAVSVDFGNLDEVNAITVRSTGGKVRVRLTSSDGSAQAVPVESLFVLITSTVGITAVDLTRETGVEISVSVFLGKRS